MISMTAIVSMQLSFAAMGELGGGYDSTAVDPRSGRYVDAPLLLMSVDAQAAYEGARVRQILRDRAEAVYEATGGRDVLDSDVFNITRYSLIWQPNESLTLHTDASYAIGAPTLFFSQAGRPDISFARRGLAYPRQMVADYGVRQDLIYRWSELDAVQFEIAVEGRYPTTRQPRGQTMFMPYASARYTHEFDENNSGELGMRVEYLALELFRPVGLGQAFLGWSHNFDESSNLLLEGGVTVVERNAGADGWDAQPYFRGRIYKRFDVQRLMFGLSYMHTFGVVSATLGTGTIDVATASAYWIPADRSRWVLFGDAGIQHGDGYNPGSNSPVAETFATFATGARWQVHPSVRLFARYELQWETNTTYRETGAPDFVRHVVFSGVQLAFGSSREALAAMVPMDELQAEEHSLGLMSDPAGAPVRDLEPARDERDRARREHLPGDPPDDELQREERERERWTRPTDANVPGATETTPGEGSEPSSADPFRNQGDDAR